MKSVQLWFVQRNLYDLLVSKDFTHDDLLKVFTGGNLTKKISPVTKGLFSAVNDRSSGDLFGCSCFPSLAQDNKYSKELTEQELSYIKDEVENYLLVNQTESTYPTSSRSEEENTKCYEIVTHSSAETINLVVVMERSFLSLVTTNPETLSSFYREIICHSFGHGGVSATVNREYLGLKMNPGYFDLVKLRCNKRR